MPVTYPDIAAAYEKYQKPLFFYIYKFVKNPERAADFVQDVFTKALESNERINNEEVLVRYLYKSARNRMINYHRWDKRKETMPLELAPEQFEDSVIRHLITEEHMGHVRSLIHKLPKQQAQIMRCMLDEGLEVGEIAKRLNTSQSAISVAKFRAIASLHKMAIGAANSGAIDVAMLTVAGSVLTVIKLLL